MTETVNGNRSDGSVDRLMVSPPVEMLALIATMEERRQTDRQAERQTLEALLRAGTGNGAGPVGLVRPRTDADAVYAWLHHFAEGDLCRRLATLAGANVRIVVCYERQSRAGADPEPWQVQLWLLPCVGIVAQQQRLGDNGACWPLTHRKDLVRSGQDLARSLEPAAIHSIADSICTGEVWRAIERNVLDRARVRDVTSSAADSA